VLRGQLGRVMAGFAAFGVGNVAATLLTYAADTLTPVHELSTAPRSESGSTWSTTWPPRRLVSCRRVVRETQRPGRLLVTAACVAAPPP
jgi:hypothetical protein